MCHRNVSQCNHCKWVSQWEADGEVKKWQPILFLSLLVFLVGERVEELRSGHINFPSPRMSAYLRRVVIQCWMLNQIKYGMLFKLLSDPRTYTQIHTPTVVQVGGGGVDGTPPQCYVAVFKDDFTFSGKPLIFLTRWGIFYGWWCCWRPVTNNGRHLGHPLGFYQELEIRLKPREIVIFWALNENNS